MPKAAAAVLSANTAALGLAASTKLSTRRTEKTYGRYTDKFDYRGISPPSLRRDDAGLFSGSKYGFTDHGLMFGRAQK
jgi:hypothetical protein